MKAPTFGEAIGALVVVIAIGVIGFSAVAPTAGDAGSKTALIGVLGAGVGYFLRAKVLNPTDPNQPTVVVTRPTTPVNQTVPANETVLVDGHTVVPRG